MPLPPKQSGLGHALRIKVDGQKAEGRENQRQHHPEPDQRGNRWRDREQPDHAQRHDTRAQQHRHTALVAQGLGQFAKQRVLDNIQQTQAKQNRSKRRKRDAILVHIELRRVDIDRQSGSRQQGRKDRIRPQPVRHRIGHRDTS